MIEAETFAIILIVVGALFMLSEVLSPGVFLIIPGTVLVILGFIGFMYPDFLYSPWSPVLALVVAAPVTIGTIKMYSFLAKPEPPTTTVADSLVGRNGVVTVRTVPENIRGKVRIDTDTWSATSSEPLEIGTEITVVSSQGVHVTVARR
ncbi:MAG: NfeD family protein [Methanomassiliicoccaceae archaeon]|nr:NfeD family protein [Methanomassiliicoccaceae archaeon]